MQTQSLRIIGGRWRGRKLTFPALTGVRPTPARVRETLFNWLAGPVQHARCVDLFAGSGALGIEALSRGANFVSLIDNAKPVVQQLRTYLKQLGGTDHSKVLLTDAERWLQQFDRTHYLPYDIVFIDAPFGHDYVAACTTLIAQQQLLSDRAWVYIEMGKHESLPPLPHSWRLYREKTAGQVCYRLFKIDQNNEQ
jgi:16S rRNA (guanine966-N2)-methyltransferase